MPGSSSLALPVANFRREGVPGSSSVVSPYRKFRQAVPDSSFVAFPVASFGRQGVPDSSFGAFLLQIWDGRGRPSFSSKLPFEVCCPQAIAWGSSWPKFSDQPLLSEKFFGEVGRPVFLSNLCSQRDWEQYAVPKRSSSWPNFAFNFAVAKVFYQTPAVLPTKLEMQFAYLFIQPLLYKNNLFEK